jgi:hypothetical protein
MRHHIRREELAGLGITRQVGGDTQVNASVLRLPDQVNGFGGGADKAAYHSARSGPVPSQPASHCSFDAIRPQPFQPQ